MIEGDGGNVALYVTNEGSILVDDKYEYDYDAIQNAVKAVTSQPVKYVMSTHHHGDHTGSSAKWLPTAEIIAQANNRINMIKGKQAGAPRVVFTDESDLFLGGKEVRARYYGRGHTNGDAVMYFPALRVVHTGDLMAGAGPLVDYNNGGSLKEWTKTLDGVLQLDFDTVIPGHGPAHKKSDLVDYRNNIEKAQTRLTSMIRSGASKDDISKAMTGEYNLNLMFGGIDPFIAEFK
jgi:glyoxylase-like metal-dependent hydrolase (beta-lactamase superfamily II)